MKNQQSVPTGAQPSPETEAQHEDFRAAFLTILGGLVHRNGLNMASEAAYQSACSNAAGLALEACKVLARSRSGALHRSMTEDGGL